MMLATVDLNNTMDSMIPIELLILQIWPAVVQRRVIPMSPYFHHRFVVKFRNESVVTWYHGPMILESSNKLVVVIGRCEASIVSLIQLLLPMT